MSLRTKKEQRNQVFRFHHVNKGLLFFYFKLSNHGIKIVILRKNIFVQCVVFVEKWWHEKTDQLQK